MQSLPATPCTASSTRTQQDIRVCTVELNRARDRPFLKQAHQSNGTRDTLRGQIGSFAASQPSPPSVPCKCHARVTMLLGERLDYAFGARLARRVERGLSGETTVGNNVLRKAVSDLDCKKMGFLQRT